MLLQLWSKEPEAIVVDLEAVVLKDIKERADVLLENESQARRVRQALDKLPPKPAT
jgi:hypothetical protein